MPHHNADVEREEAAAQAAAALAAPTPPTSAPQVPEAPAATAGGVRVAGPAWVSRWNYQTPEGTTLSVTRDGVDVPPGDVDNLIAEAAKSGVTLETRK